MSAEPMTDGRLADLMAVHALSGDRGFTVRFDNDKPGIAQTLKGVVQLADAVPELVAEVRRLRKDCEVMHAADRKAAQDLFRELEDLRAWKHNATKQLLARSEQAEELLSLRDRLVAWNAEARDLLRVAEGGLTAAAADASDRASGYVSDARASEAGKIGCFLRESTPTAALEIQRARRAVVEAAKAWRRAEEADASSEMMLDLTDQLADALDALAKLEARR